MSVIAFMVDMEEGHLFPTFELAHSLNSAGHEVIYISVLDNEELVREAGFKFYPLFTECYPKGYRVNYKQLRRSKGYDYTPDLEDHIDKMFGDSLAQFFKRIEPDLVILNCFMYIESDLALF